MKRTFILLAILIFSTSAKSDVIYFPYQYSLLSYSADFAYSNDIGFVPGFKFNYKAQLSEHMILEPYLGLSLPVTLDLEGAEFYFPFPVATIGIRAGISTLKKRTT
jgi:hypothetical protein